MKRILLAVVLLGVLSGTAMGQWSKKCTYGGNCTCDMSAHFMAAWCGDFVYSWCYNSNHYCNWY